MTFSSWTAVIDSEGEFSEALIIKAGGQFFLFNTNLSPLEHFFHAVSQWSAVSPHDKEAGRSFNFYMQFASVTQKHLKSSPLTSVGVLFFHQFLSQGATKPVCMCVWGGG